MVSSNWASVRMVVLAVFMGGFALCGIACSKSAPAAQANAAGADAGAAPQPINTVRPGAPGQPTQVLPNN